LFKVNNFCFLSFSLGLINEVFVVFGGLVVVGLWEEELVDGGLIGLIKPGGGCLLVFLFREPKTLRLASGKGGCGR
jgi:hypothetical protein